MTQSDSNVAIHEQEFSREILCGKDWAPRRNEIGDTHQICPLPWCQDSVIARHVLEHFVGVKHDRVVSYSLMPEHDHESYPRSIHVMSVKKSIFNSTRSCITLAIAQDIVTQDLAIVCCFWVDVNLWDNIVKFCLKLLKIFVVLEANVNSF